VAVQVSNLSDTPIFDVFVRVYGASLRDIAAESGISHMSVKRIVDRQPE
jgi:hypothetical protein